jgi:DNA-directed RNA polymerase subunit E'/Rpb7
MRCRITHGPWGEVVDGVVRDLHEDGARLRLGSRSNVLGRIKLEIQPSGSLHVADVVWQRGDEVGVRLIATLDQTVERQVEALRLAGAQMRRPTLSPNVDEGY